MKYVYKVVAALGAIATIPMLLFTKIFYFNMSSVAVQILALIGQYKGNSAVQDAIAQNGGELPSSMADTMSFYDIYGMVSSVSGLAGKGEGENESLKLLLVPVIVLLVIAVLIIICAIVTAVLSFVVKDNRKVIYSSVAGIGLSIMFAEAFEAISEPLLDGTITIASVLEAWWGGLLGDLKMLELTTVFWFIPIVFAGVIIWTVLYNITLPEKEKKERKLMLGEAEE